MSASSTITNITGIIVEHSISDETFMALIGTSMPDWLSKHGTFTVTIRENGDHDRVELELRLEYIMLEPDGWNRTFNYRAFVHGGPEDRIGHSVNGKINMSGPGSQFLGNLHAA